MAEKEYIERDMYYQKINDFSKGGCGDYHLYRLAINDCVKVLDEIPVADVAPVRHGAWDTISDSDMSKTVMCSVCNKMFYFTKKGQLNIDKMPHCPNCGAKMDGGEHGNDT